MISIVTLCTVLMLALESVLLLRSNLLFLKIAFILKYKKIAKFLYCQLTY